MHIFLRPVSFVGQRIFDDRILLGCRWFREGQTGKNETVCSPTFHRLLRLTDSRLFHRTSPATSRRIFFLRWVSFGAFKDTNPGYTFHAAECVRRRRESTSTTVQRAICYCASQLIMPISVLSVVNARRTAGLETAGGANREIGVCLLPSGELRR